MRVTKEITTKQTAMALMHISMYGSTQDAMTASEYGCSEWHGLISTVEYRTAVMNLAASIEG